MSRKWGLIVSGATFQALASTLLFFQDAKAVLFGIPGKDGGQDANVTRATGHSCFNVVANTTMYLKLATWTVSSTYS